MDVIPKITNKHAFDFVRTDLLSVANLNPFALPFDPISVTVQAAMKGSFVPHR